MKKLNLILLFILCVSTSYGQTKKESKYTNIGFSTEIDSKILNRTQEILVHLPFGFDSSKTYPLVVISDFMAFKPLSSITEIMAYNKTIPYCIVVCPVTTNPREDYSPIINNTEETINGGKTIEFFEKELFPFMDEKYNISKKIIWGQNYSCMFTTFVMLTRPDLFDGYISDIPQLDADSNDIEKEDCLKNIGNKSVFYHVSWTKLAPKQDEMNELLAKLNSEAPENLHWQYTEESDSVLITHVVTNYTYSLTEFFKQVK